ncbi:MULTISPECIES: HNH endonuclease signature motif containing protein [Microbacterium]|uniref:HNH endonuclease n=1 Tax=Microbacterium wangchenii TaxID=2541726 RepID=A0ABX5SSC6_9MICO|nr:MULTISPECIES: HNH endonuclease signature motif containing protein [Microbacterium]MCK6068108.1 HNH endonuclease [Microbacterium sp. EYE_512]QBR87770.1 HNH endonuclease [Microbacterium wangchenii]
METSSRPAETQGADVDRMRAGLDVVREQKSVIARAQAALIRQEAELAAIALDEMERMTSRASRDREMPMRSLSAEVAFATHVHDLTAQKELNDAYAFVTRFSATLTALEEARISKRHADVILEVGASIDNADVRAAWEHTVLDRAARETPGRTRAFARQLAEAVNPVGMSERFAEACETRGVSIVDLDDGMALLQVRLPAALAYGIRDRIRQQARIIRDAANAERARRAAEKSVTTPADAESARDAATAVDAADFTLDDLTPPPAGEAAEPTPAEVIDDTRTLVQIGADLVSDMLLTGTPAIDPVTDRSSGGLGAIRAHVQVVVPVLTLAGKTHTGASLHGQIPIDPETARRLAGDAPGWDRVMCDPITGTVLEVDRYTPRADQQRFLRARDQHCRGFGCRQPAHRCQIDHNHEHHEGGPTAIGNLAHLCTRHHTLKTETAWAVRQLGDGSLEFTSPLGNVYTDEPPPRVMFIPDGDPPPF